MLTVVSDCCAPGRGVVFGHERPLAAGLAVGRGLAGAVGAGRAGAGVHAVAPKAVGGAELEAIAKVLAPGHGAVGACVGQVGVQRTGAVDAAAVDVGVQARPEGHGVLAAQRQRTQRGGAQAHQRLPAKGAAALAEAAVAHDDALLQREEGAVALAQVFAAAKAQTRRCGVAAGGHALQRIAAGAHAGDVFDAHVDQAVDFDAAGALRQGSLAAGQRCASRGNGPARWL